MALTLKLGKKEEEVDELAADPNEIDEPIAPTDSEELLNAKLEAAELRGKLSVLQKVQPAQRNNYEQTKITVFQDANTLSDDDFQRKYNMAKHMATASVLEQENRMTKQETKQELAEARASSELSARYGTEYFKFKDQIEDTLNDLSSEVRQDPKRLAKHMERVYKSIATERPLTKAKPISSEDIRRKITPDFEKPTPEAQARKAAEDAASDEIEDQYRPLARAVGLSSESERVKYKAMVDGGEFVPMELGGGVTFSDPAKGFERAAAVK